MKIGIHSMAEPIHIPMPEQFDELRTNCGVCESEDIYKLLKDFRGNQVYRCENCGVQFQNPQYSQSYLDDYYAGYTKLKPELEPLYEITDRYKLKYLERYAGNAGKLLDLGCGNGHMLRSARRTGWEVTGYDVDPEIPKRIESELNIDVLHGDMKELVGYVNENGQFDAVVMNQVLEHVKNPQDYFSLFKKVLKPRGHLLITVPNINALSSRVKFILERLGLRKEKVGNYYDTDHHLWYFTPSSLDYLLQKYGYQAQCIRGDVSVRRLRTPWKRMKSMSLSVFRRFTWESTFLVVAQKPVSK